MIATSPPIESTFFKLSITLTLLWLVLHDSAQAWMTCGSWLYANLNHLWLMTLSKLKWLVIHNSTQNLSDLWFMTLHKLEWLMIHDSELTWTTCDSRLYSNLNDLWFMDLKKLKWLVIQDSKQPWMTCESQLCANLNNL